MKHYNLKNFSISKDLVRTKLLKAFSVRRMWKHVKRSVALTLSFMMLLQPLHAYDTDLISIASGATSPGKPNVLLILDTSDSMNIGLAWNEVSQPDADTYNSHVEYLWNNPDYIARIGCYEAQQSDCVTGAATVSDTFDDMRNHAPLTYDDAYKYGSLPQGYFAVASLKNKAFSDAQDFDNYSKTGRRRYEIRDYSGMDSLHGDRGQGQASPCKYLLAPGGTPQINGNSICATPIKSKYVWWTTTTASYSPLSGEIANGGPSASDRFIANTFNEADVATPAGDDPSLFSDSFNRFIGEDAVTPFSSLLAGNLINRGGMDFNTSRGVNYPGGYQLPTRRSDFPNQILDTVKLQLKSGRAGSNRCMSSYFGSGHAPGNTASLGSSYAPSGFIPSTVNAPGPFEKNAGYMATGWVRWQPFRNTVRDFNFSSAAGTWSMKLDNYPGPFRVTETGEVLGWRDNLWLPPRIKVGSSDAGWEPLQPDLGSFSDYYHAVLNLVNGLPSCSGAWAEYCDGSDAGRQSAPPTLSDTAGDAHGQGRWASKLPRVLAYYGIKSIPAEISNSMNFNHTVSPSADNYRVDNPTGDLRWSFAALRGGSSSNVGAAGRLTGISSYYDNYSQLTNTCSVSCKPIGTNPTSFATVNGINRTVYSYPSAVNCGVDTVPPGCTAITDAQCAPSPSKVPIRQFTGCQWRDRNSVSAPGTEAAQTIYSGGTCAATCVGDCENFNSATTLIANVGNNNIGAGESPTTEVRSSLRCNYAQDATGRPVDTTGTSGECANIGNWPNPQEVNCPTWYDGSGTAHPACIFYDGSTPAATCRPVNSTPLAGPSGLKYNFQLASSADSFFDCIADNGRSASTDLTLVNQVDYFNSSDANIDTGASQTFGNGYGDNSYGNTNATQLRSIAVYSSNYLNYKFGPKGPNKRPIGRQTRLQLAKDVLTSIIRDKGDQFRFGLMAFNDQDPATGNSRGARVIFPVSDLSSPKNPVTGKDDKQEFLKRLLWLEAHSKTPLAPSLYEAYLYYAGKEPSGGISGYNYAAYTNNVTGETIPASLSGILNPKESSKYYSPIDSTFDTSTLSGAQQAYCLKNIIILITDGGPQDDDGLNEKIKGELNGKETADKSKIGVEPQLIDPTTNLPFGPPDDKYRNLDGSYRTTTYSYLDEISNVLNKTSVKQTSPADKAFNNVTTFTIGFAGASSAVLENAGDPSVSGGKYYNADNAAELQKSITDSLGAAREYVPTLSTPVTPLSALSKSQDADEIYISTLKPSQSSYIWPGNMKKYRLGSGEPLCGTQLKKDANGQNVLTPIDLCIIGQTALNGTVKNVAPPQDSTAGGSHTPVINSNAQSYWSSIMDGANPLLGGILNRLPETYSDGTTNVPARGDVRKRVVYTHISGMFDGNYPGNQTGGTLLSLDISNTQVLNSAAFANVTGNLQQAVINKIRGADMTQPGCSDASQGPCIAFDPPGLGGSHTAPLHSPGVVVTYKAAGLGSDGKVNTAPLQRLFYVTINGMLHAVDPSDEATPQSSPSNRGKEIWGFVPEEVLSQAVSHPYLNPNATNKGVDGPVALFDGQPNVWLTPCKTSGGCNGTDVEDAILYFGMRRGASDRSATKRGAHSYYAISIKNPDAPKLLWKITSVPDPKIAPTETNPDPRIGYLCGADGKCDEVNDYSELGQTWSTPMPVKLNQRNSGGAGFVEGLVLTGGYDARQDCVLPDKSIGRRAKVSTGRKNDRDCSESVGGGGATGPEDFDTQGRAIYVVDATTGRPIVTFMDNIVEEKRGYKMKGVVIHPPIVSGTPGTTSTGNGLRMSNSVAGAVGAYNMDLDAANTIDRLYVGDMGGVLWRVDMQNTDVTKWAVYPIASLSTIDGNNNVLSDRPIFFQPQVLLSNDNADLAGNASGQDKYDYVYIPTSDFEHPTEVGKGVNNKLFMVKDWESRGSLLAGKDSVLASELKPAIMGAFVNGSSISSSSASAIISYSYGGSGSSQMLNVTPFTVKPGDNPQVVADNRLKLLPGSQVSWSNLSGWYIDFDIDPTTGKQYADTNKWVEVATGPALIYKDRNPASSTYGSSILNFTTYRYGTVDQSQCTVSGTGYTWAMEATTGAAIVTPPLPGSPGQGSPAAAPVTRIGNENNGGFASGSGTTSGVAATPALKVINCQIVKTATASSLAYSVVGEACSATKAYWYNQLSND